MRRTFFLLPLLLLLSYPFASAQHSGFSGRNPRPATDPQFGQRRNAPDPAEKQMEHERVKALNKERQAAIQRDTDKLLTLATELKHYVDKTNENVLSVNVVRKAEEIEKLAHRVKEKMKD